MVSAGLVHLLEGAAVASAIVFVRAARARLQRPVPPIQPPAIAPEAAPEPRPQAEPNPGPQKELPMSLNVIALASRVAVGASVTAAQAVTIVNEAVSLIGLAENLYEGVKGDAKFKAVMKGLDAVVERLGLTDKVEAIREAVAPVINLVVSVLNSSSLWGSVFSGIATFAKTVADDISAAANKTGENAGGQLLAA